MEKTAEVRLGFLFYVSCLFYVATSSSSCSSYGCNSAGTFSYSIKTPKSKPTIAWTASMTIGPVNNSLGCVANSYNVFCPGTVGYVGLYIETGGYVAGDYVLRQPPLPLTTDENDLIGSDGHYFVHYNDDGRLEARELLPNDTFPVFSTRATMNNVIFLASTKGHVMTTSINGTVLEIMMLNGTMGEEEGTFYPIATPAVAGYRAYVLTVFLPTGKDQRVTSNGQHRLYAIDAYYSSEHSMHIAYFIDLDPMTSREHSNLERPWVQNNVVNFEQTEEIPYHDRKMNAHQDDYLEPRVICTNEVDRVFVSIPEASTVGVLYGIKENGFGKNGSMVFKQSLALAKMSMAQTSSEADSGEEKGNDMRRRIGRKPQAGTATLWGLQGDKENIVEINSETGSILSTRNISEILNARMHVTSEVMVVEKEDKTAQQSLVFGVKADFPVPPPNFSALCESMGTSPNATSYLVQLDEDAISWMIATPKEHMEIKGQIAGIKNTQGNDDGPGVKDMLVVFAGNTTRSAIFSVY